LSLLYAFGLTVWRLRGHVAACRPMISSVDDLSFLVGSCEVGGFYFYSFLADWEGEGRMRCVCDAVCPKVGFCMADSLEATRRCMR
jgi:hypothetical protein